MSNYPRLIHLDEDTETRLVSYIEQELMTHYGERSAWVDELVDLQKEYFAKPSSAVRTFPFKGAAGLIIPLIAIAVETFHSKAMTQLFALEDFVTVKVPGVFEDVSWGLNKYINYSLLENGVDMYRFADNALLENWKFGSMVGKSGYECIEKTVVREIGDEEQEFTITTKKGAVVDNVPLANFLMPFSSQDPQTAPWCGEEHLWNSFKFKQNCDSGLFYEDTWKDMESWVMQTNSQEQSSANYVQTLRDLQNQNPVWPKDIGFVELWMGFDIDKSGKTKEIVVYYHRLSRKLLGIRYNWYDDARRPYRIGKYFTVENRWAGIGIGHQTKVFQREVTIQHRQRLDNATIANIRMFKINKLAGYSPGEPIFPGKLWFVDNMDDIESLEAGEVYPSSFNDEIQTLNYAQQRNGIGDLQLGQSPAGTPGTATENMARLQEGNKKADYVMKNTKRFLTEITHDVVYNDFHFGTRNIEIFNYIPNGPLVQQYIQNAPMSLINSQIIMNVKLVGQSENKIQDRASWTQIGGQLTQYYTQMFQFAQQIGDKNLTAILAKYIPMGATEAMQQILQTYDIPNLEKILPEELIRAYSPQMNPMALASGGGGEQNGNGSGQVPNTE